MRYILTIGLLLLTGCCIPKAPIVVDHKVMVTVPCKTILPARPVMPLTDTGKVEDDIFVKSKKALAEIDIRKGYEAQLEAAARSCQ